MRKRYHKWDDTSLAMLRTYRDQGLSWEIIAGKISAIYDTLLSAESCRAAHTRYGATAKTTRKRKGETLGLSLPIAFADPPASVLGDIEDDKERIGFSQLYYTHYNATPNEKTDATNEHWNYYINFVAETSDLTEDDIKAAQAHGSTKWFKRWIKPFSMWRPQTKAE